MIKHALPAGALGAMALLWGMTLTGCPGGFGPWYRYLGSSAGDDSARAVIAAPGGGYVIAGFVETRHESDDDALLMKINEQGLREWEYIIGTGDDDVATCVVAAHGGGYVFGGEFGEENGDSESGFVSKVSESGEEVWAWRFRGPGANRVDSLAATTDGAYVALVNSDYLGAAEVVLVKLGAEGGERWRQIVAAPATGVKAVALEDGAVAVVTWNANADVEDDGRIAVRHVNAAGVAGATFSVEGENALLARDAVRVENGWIIVGQDNFRGNDAHAAVLRLDGSGQVMWRTLLGAGGRDEARAVIQAKNGDLLVAGSAHEVNGRPHMYLARLKSDGTLRWERAYGEDDQDEAFGLANAPGGGVLLVGRSDTYEDDAIPPHFEILIVRTSPQGHCPGIETALPPPAAE